MPIGDVSARMFANDTNLTTNGWTILELEDSLKRKSPPMAYMQRINT